MTITLTYTLEDGTQERVELGDDVTEIDLAERTIEDLDLGPLSTCGNLHTLKLNGNKLQNIDLTPLSSCASLEVLELHENVLKSIDLSPLSSCKRLLQLWLYENQLTSLNLDPLSTCSNLQILGFDWNRIEEIDLSPLSTCTRLSLLSMGDNPLKRVDLTPLSFCSRLEVLEAKGEHLLTAESWLPLGNILSMDPFEKKYGRPFRIYPWSFLLRVLSRFENDQRVRQDILRGMGLGDFGFIENEFMFVLHSYLLRRSQDEALYDIRRELEPTLVDEVMRAARAGGPTTGLVLDTLAARYGAIASVAQAIIESRDAEMRRVTVGVAEEVVDLRELHLTAYGYEILSALGMRLETDPKGLEQIRPAFAELGYEVNTSDESIPGVSMSDELRGAILWIVENRGHAWSKILRTPSSPFKYILGSE